MKEAREIPTHKAIEMEIDKRRGLLVVVVLKTGTQQVKKLL